MAFPTYTNTFTNGSTADATQVNQNFTDILNGVTDTTKDISVNAFTTAGTSTLNGNVILGNGTTKDITFNGSLASSIPIKTHNSFDIGSITTLGLRAIYFASSSATKTIKVVGSATASDLTITLPSNTGALATTTLIGFRVQKTPTSSAFDGTVALIFPSNVLYDTASGYNTSTGVYTIPTTGYWQISCQVGVSATWGLNSGLFLILKKSTTTQSYSTQEAGAAALFNLNIPHTSVISLTSGDTISFRVQIAGTGTGPAISSDDNSSWFEARWLGV